MDGFDVLVDTSVWVDHLRAGDSGLVDLLDHTRVRSHPFVIGELACGNLRNRSEILTLLKDLPQAPVASHDEVLLYIESQQLMGRGVGYVDAHLLASAALAGQMRIWTGDKRLQTVATALALAYEER